MHESSLSPVQLERAVESVCAVDPSGFNAKLDVAEMSRNSTDKDSLLHLLQLRSVKTQVEQRKVFICQVVVVSVSGVLVIP